MASVASVAQWVEGARPRTLPNAIAPRDRRNRCRGLVGRRGVVEGLLALVVAVAMIIGVNYANDYSDGIRGTDDVAPGRCGWSDPVWPHRVRCSPPRS